MKNTHQAVLKISSNLGELPKVRAFLREVCSHNLDLDCIGEGLQQLDLAVTEAMSNVMVHGLKRQPDHEIRIEAEMNDNELSLRFFHKGEAFVPHPEAASTLEGPPRENKMGMYIIRQCVDKVNYHRAEPDENCVHLVKAFRQGPKEGEQA